MELYIELSERFDDSTVIYFFNRKSYTALSERVNICEDYLENTIFLKNALENPEKLPKEFRKWWEYVVSTFISSLIYVF